MPLTGKQRHHLRGLGHHLKPVVQVGKQGLTDSVSKAVDDALTQHELIKVKLGTSSDEEQNDVATRLAEALGAEVAQVVGRTVLLYRRHPEEPKIELPD